MTQAGPSTISNRKYRKTSSRFLPHLVSLSMAQALARKMGIPLPDRLPGPYLPPTREGLMETVTYIPRDGKLFHQHPELYGRGYAPKQVDTAIDFVIEAEKALFEGVETISPGERPSHAVQLILDIVDNKEFGAASKKADTRTQMRIALAAVTVKNRIEEIMKHNPSMRDVNAKKQAKKDVETAQKLATQFIDLRCLPQKQRPADVPELVTRMSEMEWKGADAELFEFDVAMKAIDEQRQAKLKKVEAPPKKSIPELLKDMMPQEKELVMGALIKTGACNEDDLAIFINMRPGVRDLLVKNFIASRWTEGDWRKDFETYSEVRKSVYKLCGLREPTKEEKIDAVLQIRYLTYNQLHFIARTLDGEVTGPPSARHVNDFRKWVTEDPERLDHWKVDTVDLLTLGDLMHKIRFRSGWEYTPEETLLLSRIINPDAPIDKKLATVASVQMSKEDRSKLGKAFVSPLYDFDEEGSSREYNPQFRAVSQFGNAMETESLLEAAQKEAEFHVLLDFLDVPVEKASGRIDCSNCETRPKKKDGTYSTNDDSVSSAVVTLDNGTKVILDAVFDGMGGHAAGHVASGLAKDVFEIAAVAGWIKTPEDVRRVFIIAHLAITMEQIHTLKEIRGSDDYPESRARYWLQENDMGTTGVVSYQCGNEFYGIHCGDSDYKVIRDGEVALQSTGHTLVNEMLAAGHTPHPGRGHIVTSALGAVATKIHINDEEGICPAFVLEDNDIIFTASDGITVPVCEHEIQIMIDQHGGDLVIVRRELIELAESRAGVGPYPTLCGCNERRGKTDDDKTVVLRYAKDST